ncbi:MAG: DNA damage-inducible protein D [Dongiaceae bacterium]
MEELTDLTVTPAYRTTMERLESLKRVTATGKDYWTARDIHPVLGYPTWKGFEGVMQRAKDACSGTGIDPQKHFGRTTKMVGLGSGAERRVEDHFLSRAACYLIAMNGDPAKPEIAAAHTYFAIQTRRMELQEQENVRLNEDERRLELRNRVRTSFKKVSKVAQEAGVRNRMQPIFHDARYQGLYGAPLKDVRRKKGIKATDNLFDYAGPLELSANDFQMNLAAEVINREGIKGEQRAIETNRTVGTRVRKVIADSGSPLPEELPVGVPIKEIESRLKGNKKLAKPT